MGVNASPHTLGGLDHEDSPVGQSVSHCLLKAQSLNNSTDSRRIVDRSAVGVSAGYAPVSIGTETAGSLVSPATRAALYTLKATIGSVSQKGMYPISHTFDAVGPIAKTPYDLAIMMNLLMEKHAPGYPPGCFTDSSSGSWSDLSVATLDYTVWRWPPSFCKPVESATKQMVNTHLHVIIAIWMHLSPKGFKRSTIL